MKSKEIEEDTIIELDGIKIKLEQPDLDGDGEIGAIEHISTHPDYDSGVSHLTQKSELAESLEKLDEDTVDPDTKMSKIDLNSNLNTLEKNGYGVLDFLVSISFLPKRVLFMSRQFKRLSVSVNGTGRKQKVEMVTGQRDYQQGLGSSFMEKAKGLFGGGEQK